MIQKIRVKTKNGRDIKGEGILHDIHHLLGEKSVLKVETATVYRLEGVTEKQAHLLAEKLLYEKINQSYSLNKPLINGASRVIEIAYKPGVMNPEVASIIKAAKDLGIHLNAADSSNEYGFYGKISKDKIIILIQKLNLFNNTVEQIVEKDPTTLLIKGVVGQTEIIPMRNMRDKQLIALAKDRLFLNLEEMQIIQKYFQKIQRDPTDCEIETLAQTWSEHSGHKTFKAAITVYDKDLPAGRQEKDSFIKRIKQEALKHKKHIVSAFVDNSGVMDFYDGFAICGKGETHNSPSAIEPYGGAMTGSGGVFRDIVGTGQGGKTICSTDIFCLGLWNMSSAKLPPGTLSPGYVLRRVVQAVKDYGNRMGIPTNNGSFHFHEDFRAKPTVLVGAYGILPKKLAQKGNPKKGDIIISIGGRVGRDGIHGATFSSAEMTDRTITVNAQAVQIGNAIEEKRMFDAIIEARDLGLVRMIQDSGGGGLSSAVGEMGSKTGVRVQLKNERLKYQGLSPWEIWLSESQERMLLAIPPKKLNSFINICKKYNVELSNLGVFDGSKKLQVYYGNKKVCDLDMEFLHNGLPQRKMIALAPKIQSKRKEVKPKPPTKEKEWIKILTKIVSHGNVCSKEPIVRMYDHSVQGTNDLQPYSGEQLDGPNDAVVLRPLLNKPYGMVISHGLNPILNKIDPYWGSIWAAAEALSNYVAVGGDYKEASLINNYVWPFPDEESLWSLDKSVTAVVDIMKIFKTPVISGKDSLSSTYRGKDGTIIKIPPVLCIAAFGRIPNASQTVSSDFKKYDSIICLVGKPDISSLGGSIYYDMHNILGTSVPHADLKTLPKIFNTLHASIKHGQILSCHDVSEGGILTTLFEMCVGGNCGAQITIPKKFSKQADNFLFTETAGCFLVEVEHKTVAKKIFKNTPYMILGNVTKEKTITARNEKKQLFSASVDELKNSWKKPMQKIFS